MDDPLLNEKIDKLERILYILQIDYTRTGNSVVSDLPYLVMEELTTILDMRIENHKIIKVKGVN